MSRTCSAALLLLALTLSGCSSDEPRSDGPLETGDTIGVTTLPVNTGQQVGWGDTFITNTGSDEVVLTGAHLASDELPVSVEELGVVVNPTGTVIALELWGDSNRPVPPLAGQALQPGDTAQVVFVLNVEGEGRLANDAVTVEYTYDGHAYTSRAERGFRLCVPAAGHCELDEDLPG